MGLNVELITRTAKLIPYGRRPRRLAGFVTAYTYEPMADDAAAGHGNLYVVIEVLNGGRQSEDTADLIIETFGRSYYDASYQNDDILTRFEHALKATNRELANFIGQGNAAWVGKLSAVIAVQHEAELHLAHVGSAEAYLYRGKSSAKITAGGSQSNAPSKTFSMVTSGELEDGDRLLLSTPALFHQLPLTKLKAIISGATPSGAVSEVTQILESAAYAQIDRIAVILVELVSPERAASQTLSTEPSEVLIGSPETPIEAVKHVAAPIALATAQQARTAHEVARSNWDRSKPHIAKAKDAARHGLGSMLGSHKRLMIAACVIVGIAVVGGGITLAINGDGGAAGLIKGYDAAYQSYRTDATSSTASRAGLARIRADLGRLSPSERSRIDMALKDSRQAPGAPRTVALLETAIQNRLDELDMLTRVDGKVVTSSSSPSHASIEVNKGLAYLVTTGTKPELTIVNLTTGKSDKKTGKLSAISDVLMTTISYDKRGIYLMSSTSGLWYYDFAADTASKQSIADSAWENADAIASYATNIYVLGDSKTYKHTKNLTGYSPKTVYSAAPGATGLAVDGTVLVGYPGRLDRLTGGSISGTITLPDGFARPTVKLSADTGVAVINDQAHGRIGIVDLGDKLSFRGQYLVKGYERIEDAECDLSSGLCYALADGKLLSFPVAK